MKILIGWELGTELGQLSYLAELTRTFIAEDNQVVLALHDLSRPHFFFKGLDVKILQAPIWPFTVQMDRPVYCLADVLMAKGYLYDTSLRNLVEAWQAIIDLVQPDLVVCDYSPSLLLALWNTPIPRVIIGTGFSNPVPGTAMQDWRPNKPRDGIVAAQEKRLLNNVNTALEAQGKPPLQFFSDIFRADITVLKTLPQLDLQGARRGEDTVYCVPHGNSKQQCAEWADAPGKKIFAILSPQHPRWEILLNALQNCAGNVFLSCPGDKRQRLKGFDRGNFRLSTKLVDIPASLEQADLFISHGSMGALAQSLVAGTPALNIPIYLEQLLNAINVQKLGAGHYVAQIESAAALTATINSTLEQASLQAGAEAMAQQWADSPACTTGDLVQRCLAAAATD